MTSLPGRRRIRRSCGVVLSAAAAAALLPGCVATTILASSAESRFPDAGGHVVADGVRIRYVERFERGASARPVVLLHGAYGGLEDWEATILPDVARRGRAIAFDRPGHGWSGRPCDGASPVAQARVLREACRQLGADRPVLVGFSWGGAVAAAWASEWPDEVAGLVLLNAPTHPWGGGPGVVDAIATTPILGDLAVFNLFVPLGAVLAPGLSANAFAPDPVSPSFVSSPIDLAIRPDALRANAEDVAGLDPALAAQAPRYPRIRCPVTFVVGERDRIVGPEWHSPRFAAEVPGTRRLVVPGAGHQLPYAHPDACLEAIDDVLRRASARL